MPSALYTPVNSAFRYTLCRANDFFLYYLQKTRIRKIPVAVALGVWTRLGFTCAVEQHCDWTARQALLGSRTGARLWLYARPRIHSHLQWSGRKTTDDETEYGDNSRLQQAVREPLVLCACLPARAHFVVFLGPGRGRRAGESFDFFKFIANRELSALAAAVDKVDRWIVQNFEAFLILEAVRQNLDYYVFFFSVKRIF